MIKRFALIEGRLLQYRRFGRGEDLVINISSGAATSALEGWSHYCATKAALLNLTRTAHKERPPTGVKVIGLSLGTVATDMQRAIKSSGINPVGRLDWGSPHSDRLDRANHCMADDRDGACP